jgi:hypothetical protein
MQVYRSSIAQNNIHTTKAGKTPAMSLLASDCALKSVVAFARLEYFLSPGLASTLTFMGKTINEKGGHR